MRYYIASGLENVAQVRELKQILDAAGWTHTYDWTTRGSVTHDAALLRQVAEEEVDGVATADVVVVLLPGGRGTHGELGMALAYSYLGDSCRDVRIVVYSPNPERDFGTSGETSVFYHHPYVERFSSWPEMVRSLLEGE